MLFGVSTVAVLQLAELAQDLASFFFFFLLLTRSGKICVIYLSVLFRNSFLICLMFLGTTLIKAVIWQITRKLTFKKQINHLFL